MSEKQRNTDQVGMVEFTRLSFFPPKSEIKPVTIIPKTLDSRTWYSLPEHVRKVRKNRANIVTQLKRDVSRGASIAMVAATTYAAELSLLSHPDISDPIQAAAAVIATGYAWKSIKDLGRLVGAYICPFYPDSRFRPVQIAGGIAMPSSVETQLQVEEPIALDPSKNVQPGRFLLPRAIRAMTAMILEQ